MRNNQKETRQLSATTLKIYIHLLEQGEPQGPREIARALNLSSPSIAYYHLRKLEELGLAKKTSDGYTAVPGARIEGYITIGRRVLPRLKFYALLYAGLLIVELLGLALTILNKQVPKPELMILIVITVVTVIIFVKESKRIRGQGLIADIGLRYQVNSRRRVNTYKLMLV